LLLPTFYHGPSTNTRETMDAAVGCAFLSLTLTQATNLVEKMASNQAWNEECQPPQERNRNAPAQGGRHVVCQNGFIDEEA
jgi:hypothetical protein